MCLFGVALHRWDEGFAAIGDALLCPCDMPEELGDVCSMFSLIFRLSGDSDSLQLRIDSLVDLYQQAAEHRDFARPDDGSPLRRSGNGRDAPRTQPNVAGTSPHSAGPAINPLSHLADGLVKSLAKIDPTGVNPVVLEGYLAAVAQRVVRLREFEIPLRLFRYGIRYLISKQESEFVELIKPERHILRQALGLDSE